LAYGSAPASNSTTLSPARAAYMKAPIELTATMFGLT
jgi:hypothetical protein